MSDDSPVPIKPSERRKSFLGAASALKPTAADNMKQKKIVSMTFNMPEYWHREFKMHATQRGMSMRDFLVEIFNDWRRSEHIQAIEVEKELRGRQSKEKG